MAYWWVNNKQTHAQEVGGNYLWSPKKKSDGSKSHFYDNMNLARIGDIVFAYADGEIRAIGVVTAPATTSTKPEEFSSVAINWSNEGWYLPVDFVKLSQTIRPKSHINQIAPLLPHKYSPLQPNGNGNQAAYLSSISDSLGNFLIGLVNDTTLYLRLQSVGRSAEIDLLDNQAELELRNQKNIPETEKEQLIKARIGQGIFRSNVENLEKSCQVTGITQKEHLRGSHIKPWRDSNNYERLDGNNGLLLSPHVDHLFDKGFISFENDGKLIISQYLDTNILTAWHINPDIQVDKFRPEQFCYLEYHRNNILQKAK